MTSTADINECLSNPCINSGNCTDLVNQYTCSCVAGYTGTNCETGICENMMAHFVLFLGNMDIEDMCLGLSFPMNAIRRKWNVLKSFPNRFYNNDLTTIKFSFICLQFEYIF